MDLVITGSGGTRACSWESYALVRDNVLHFLDTDRPSGRFSTLYGIARAVDGGKVKADAVHLRLETLMAWRALQWVPMARAATSSRTCAIHTGRPVPDGEVRIVATGEPDKLPVAASRGTPIPWVAGDFLSAILELTDSARAADMLEVCRA